MRTGGASRRLSLRALLVCIATAAATPLAADAIASDAKRSAAATSEAWSAECGSCHVAYPPRLLPARSWHALLDGLDRHFGADASVDAATVASIRAYLVTNAGRDRSPSAPPALRITQTRWFVHEHGGVPAAAWRNPSIGSAANCGACHRGAGDGRFGEHDVRIPQTTSTP